MTEVNKSELAKHLGVKPPMVTKHIKSGTLDKCFTPNGKKLYLEKAVQAIALSQKKDSKKIVEVMTPQDVKDDENLFTDDANEQLQALIDSAQSPSQKVQIIKDFWVGKINRQKFLEAEGELLSVHDAKVAIDAILTPLNQHMNDMGNNLKNHFPDIPNEVIEWIDEENNRQKEQLKVKEWD